MTGMTVMRLVMTVRAQKDMSPHGSTYPMKAVPIIASQMASPCVVVCPV